MALHFDLAWLVSVLLLATRVAGATVLIPILGPTEVPGSVRVILAMTLAAILLGGLSSGSTAAALASLQSVGALTAAMGCEAVIGAGLGFGFLVAYAATQVAGRSLDSQMGFSAASVFNPTLRSPSPIVGTLLGLLAVVVFLSLDGHHLLIRALAASAQAVPPGSVLLPKEFPWDALFAQSSVMFTFGLALAAPVMFSLLLADLAVALFSRSVPQLNAFVLGFAIKVLLGLAGLAASVRLGNAVFERLFSTTFRFWDGFGPATR
jgi:flagellar biosynthesis protein FliR